MKKYLLIIIFILITQLFALDFNQSYIQVYGEGPRGRHPINFDYKVYSQTDAVLYAKNEIFEFLEAMVYGYNFIYKVENKITGAKGYFDLNKIGSIHQKDRNITLNQIEESQISIKIQALYRLNENQKMYISGFNSTFSKISSGESSDNWASEWDKRIEVYKDAIKTAVLNGARRSIKSRPQYIKGKILLKESPKFFVNSGEWRCIVKISLAIQEVEYIDSY